MGQNIFLPHYSFSEKYYIMTCMNLFGISGLITGATSLILSFVILLTYGYKNNLGRTWFLFSFLVAVWGFGSYEISKTQSPESAIFLWRLIHIGIVMIPSVILHFTFSFLNINRKKLLLATYIMGFFFLLSNATPYFISNTRYVFNSFYYDSPPTVLYLFFVVYFFASFVYTIYLLYKNYRKTEDKIKRKQIFYFLVATIVGFLGGGTNFLPVFGIDIYPILNFTVPLYPAILLFAIFKYQFLNIKIITTELFSGLILAVVLGEMFFIKSSTEFVIRGVVFLILIFFSYMVIRSVYAEIRQREHIEKLLKMRSEFLDIASHQLKTPVSVIMGTTSMFKDGTIQKLPKEQQDKFIDNIYRKSVKLSGIIRDILSASEFDTEKFSLPEKRLESVDLEKFLEKTKEDFSDEAKEKGLELNFIKKKTAISPIASDEFYLTQAINNIIDNAIEYTKTGKVDIVLDEDDKNVFVKIKDTGAGIPEKDKSRIFGKFERASNAVDMYTDGSGLGLFISKEIIDAHKGASISFISKEGEGTEFIISFPKM